MARDTICCASHPIELRGLRGSSPVQCAKMPPVPSSPTSSKWHRSVCNLHEVELATELGEHLKHAVATSAMSPLSCARCFSGTAAARLSEQRAHVLGVVGFSELPWRGCPSVNLRCAAEPFRAAAAPSAQHPPAAPSAREYSLRQTAPPQLARSIPPPLRPWPVRNVLPRCLPVHLGSLAHILQIGKLRHPLQSSRRHASCKGAIAARSLRCSKPLSCSRRASPQAR